MAFAAIADVIKKILEEPAPPSTNAILSLAKTDQEKQAKLKAILPTDIEHLTCRPDRASRTSWLKQCYKMPIAAAGVRNSSNTNATPTKVSRTSSAEFECEKARERRLRRQATQGVVALFNAVSQHQSVLSRQMDPADPMSFHAEKVAAGFTPSDFLDRLSAGLPGTKSKPVNSRVSDCDHPAKKCRMGPI